MLTCVLSEGTCWNQMPCPMAHLSPSFTFHTDGHLLHRPLSSTVADSWSVQDRLRGYLNINKTPLVWFFYKEQRRKSKSRREASYRWSDGPASARQEHITPLKVQSPLCLCIQASIWQNPVGFPLLRCLFTSIAWTLWVHEVKERGGVKWEMPCKRVCS